MKELGITKGEFLSCYSGKEQGHVLHTRTKDIAVFESYKDLILAKDAFNTAQKINLLPSELLERYNEAMEALKGIERECDNQNSSHENIWRIAYGLLKKHEQTISKAKP